MTLNLVLGKNTVEEGAGFAVPSRAKSPFLASSLRRAKRKHDAADACSCFLILCAFAKAAHFFVFFLISLW